MNRRSLPTVLAASLATVANLRRILPQLLFAAALLATTTRPIVRAAEAIDSGAATLEATLD